MSSRGTPTSRRGDVAIPNPLENVALKDKGDCHVVARPSRLLAMTQVARLEKNVVSCYPKRMISPPLYVFLFIYLGFLLFFTVFIFINFTHLFHTGTFTLASFLVSFFFLAYTAIVLWGTWNFLQTVDWQQPVVIWNNAWLGNTFSYDQVTSPFRQ